MPNKYIRNTISLRGNWTEESLKAAIGAVKNDGLSIRAAAITYKIPRKTLERRCKENNDKKGPMGPSSLLGKENEQKLANHIKLMQKRGFPLTIADVRTMAYEFAEQLNLQHRFNTESRTAGYDWLKMFLKRNSDITLRKSEGVSLARCNAMNKTEVDAYFQLLESVLIQNNETLAPNCIFNMDETGLQLNNRPGYVLAKKGSKVVSTVTSTEKGETITVIACCNAEGNFLPPACIMKGKNKKAEFEDGMPPGAKIFMSVKSAYITSAIFLEWLETHFVPRKPPGKVVLLLDGHSTHCNSVQMLEYANQNDIILISMPSHTSHYLQPLDRSVFKSLKINFYEQCRLWLNQNPSRRITRLSFGTLLSKAWGKAASAENAIAGFRATGVYPFNPDAVPNYAFRQESGLSDTSNGLTATERNIGPVDKLGDESVPSCSTQPNQNLKRNLKHSTKMVAGKSNVLIRHASEPKVLEQMRTSPKKSSILNSVPEKTPSQILKDLSQIPEKHLELRKRPKQVGTLLTSDEHIRTRRSAEESKKVKDEKRILNQIKKEKEQIRPGPSKISAVKRATRKRKAIRQLSDSSTDDDVPMLCDSSKENLNKEEDNCRGCGENYYETRLIEDWLQCVVCKLWVHENCTELENMCTKCGQKKKKTLRVKD